jgi:hypothetical protein
MAKRAAPDEQPHRPLLDLGLVSAALTPVAPASANRRENAATSTNLVGFRRSEPLRKEEVRRGEVADTTTRAFESNRTAQPVQPFVEKFDQEKRVLFTRSESLSLERLVTSLATRLNAQVKVSHLIRSLVALLLNAEGELDKRAGEANPLTTPPNGDAQAIQRFEKNIAGIIGAAIRDGGPVR